MNIVLIGMPGSGKSTVGVVLAKVLGYEFVDSDIVIQHQEGMLLHEILGAKGLDGFLAIEGDVNASIEVENSVIATGGSAVYSEKAMKHFKERKDVIVYIKLSYETLVSRLGDLRERGVALKDDMTLEELYEERCPLYEKYADVVVEPQDLTVEQTMYEIKEKLNL